MSQEIIKDKVLVTGGLGYIGSHTVVALHEAGYETVIYDNLSNSSEKVVPRLEQLTGNQIEYVLGDVRDVEKLRQTVEEHRPTAVIHFAALKSVSESVQKPLEYYSNNVEGTTKVLDVISAKNIKKFIFSSSATVYGDIDVPAREDMPLGETTNPYGTSKAMCERIIKDLVESDQDWSAVSLRYFNPAGAHPSGLIGEDPKGVPNNLMPYVAQVATKQLAYLTIHGDDYPTPDGTGVRDYIHVMDLAAGHVAALRSMRKGLTVYNLGTGRGYSVKELVGAFEDASGKAIGYKVGKRRDGDLPTITADPSKAARELDWKTQFDLDDMCQDAWNWQSKNPRGY